MKFLSSRLTYYNIIYYFTCFNNINNYFSKKDLESKGYVFLAVNPTNIITYIYNDKYNLPSKFKFFMDGFYSYIFFKNQNINHLRGYDLLKIILESKAIKNKKNLWIVNKKEQIDTLKTYLQKYNHISSEIIDCENIKFDEKEIIKMKNTIYSMNKDNIFFGIGSGIQERMASNWDNNANFFCIGAALDFATGKQIIAPRFFLNLKLEWLWRFMKNPIKMYKRVFLDPLIFIYSILIYKLN